MKEIVRNQKRFFSGFPIENPVLNTINLELTNICDLHCKMCNRSTLRERGFMPVSLVESILPEAAEMGVRQIGLHSTGESILHRGVGDIVALCKKYGFYSYLDVNGNSLSADKSRALLDAGLDSIKFSIDAADDELYAKIRRGGNFTKVLDNIKTLRELRDAEKSGLRMFALFIIMQENLHQLAMFKEKVGPFVDEIQYTVINNSAGRMSKGDFEKSLIGEFDAPNKLGICANPWTRLVITWDAYVSMCCIDFGLDMKIGKYEKGNLASLWHSESACGVRKAMLEGRRDELPSICKGCDNLRIDMAERSRIINEKFK